ISPQNHVLVLATTATVQSHAYTHALNSLGLEAYEKACPLLVPLVEEGWTNHPVTDEVLRIYLTEALAEAPAANTLLLGCTHYPLLEPAIRRTLAAFHHPLHIIDSAQATAGAVATHLQQNTSLQPTGNRLLRHRFHRKIPAPRLQLPRPTSLPGQPHRPRRLTLLPGKPGGLK